VVYYCDSYIDCACYVLGRSEYLCTGIIERHSFGHLSGRGTFCIFFAFGSNGILKFAFSKNVQNCPGVYRTSILRLRKASNFAVSAKLKDSGKY
jgi:hypothetical protein